MLCLLFIALLDRKLWSVSSKCVIPTYRYKIVLTHAWPVFTFTINTTVAIIVIKIITYPISRITIIRMTSYAPITSKIELSGATNQGIKYSRNRIIIRESSMAGG